MLRVLALGLMLVSLFVARATAGTITPDLYTVLETLGDGEMVPVIVMMREQVDLDALNAELDALHATRAYRHERVVLALRHQARRTQAGLRVALGKARAEGRVKSFEPLWLSNLVLLEARKDFVQEVSERPDVGEIYIDYEIEPVRPVSSNPAPEHTTASIEPGLERINAPLAWARGYTGAGRLVSHLDTGVDGNHPALASRWRGLHAPASECWYDPVTNTNFPFDSGYHGTHTMGTITGYDPATDDHIGVAYNAEWISAGVIDRVDIPTTMADALLAFQWTADPDGDPFTIDDVPDVSSNSWGISPIWHSSYLNGACDPYFWTALDGCEAAGVVVVYAAGNEGNSPPNSIRNPANRGVDPYNSFCVGAIDGANFGNDPVAWFSSYGPAPADCGPFTTKPEVAAPGVNVRSSFPGGGYGNLDGTSMATPHVAGAVAILREADPNATSEQIKYALMQSAQDLGSPGEDNVYGWGLIDINAALDILGASGCWWQFTCTPNNAPIVIPDTGGPFSFDASLTNNCDSTRTQDVWSMVRLPDGTPYGPVLLYTGIPFGANQTRSVTGMTHQVPGGAPQGSYRYTLYRGSYPGAPEDSCSFNFYKQGTGGGGPYNVLIALADLSTGDASDVQNAIAGDGRFIGSDVMDVSAATPTLNDLLPYDVVQVWSNYAFADPTALGNVLADYVDVGGAVVLSQFSFTSSWAIGGRMMSDYSPLGVGYNYFTPVSLGTYDATHPIMQGVTTLSDGSYAVDAPTQLGATVVASWDNGYPCVAVNPTAPRVVALNMYFGTTYSQLGGDWATLVTNALAYAGDNSFMRVTDWKGNDMAIEGGGTEASAPADLRKRSDLPATGAGKAAE